MPGFTKKAIQHSLMKLLNQRPLRQITVKDIVEDCGINRNSFYYHYADLPSLLEEMIIEQADAMIMAHPLLDSLEDCLSAAIQFALENKKAVMHIYRSANRDLYEKHLFRICDHMVSEYLEAAFQNASIKEKDRAIIIQFYKCECFGQIINWMEGDMKEDISASFARLCELRKGLMEEMLKRSAQ